MNILITGRPRVGKTTLIKKIASKLKKDRLSGFYTEEMRESGRRVGFRIVTFDDKEEILSHVNIKSRYRVSKYKVNLEGFERTVLPLMDLDLPTKIFIIDEIGKMECFSKRFINKMQQLLDSEKVVVATVAMKGYGFIDSVKKRNDVKLIEVTTSNRDRLDDDIVRYIQKIT